MFWIAYSVIVLIVSGLVGFHLGRFREAYTEMTGMMAGMTMGMINGFLLGYAGAAVWGSVGGVTTTVSLFWGDLVGIVLGLALGAYFGRAGGLMGIMDGSMGGLMGGSMGAMLAAMLTFPEWALYYTSILLLIVYVASMLGLVALIEKSAPGHAALHLILPYFSRAVAIETQEELAVRSFGTAGSDAVDHYSFLGIDSSAGTGEITEAYVARLSGANQHEIERAERALVILTDPVRRRAYDQGLAVLAEDSRPACCPPKKKRSATAVAAAGGRAPAKTVARVAPAGQSGVRPGPVIGGGLGALLALGLVSWFLLGHGSSTAVGAAGAYTDSGRALSAQLVEKLRAEAVPAVMGSDGRQTLDFAVNGDSRGYQPHTVKVKQGIPVHFNLKVVGADPDCGRLVVIQGLGARGIARPGEVTSMDFTPSKSGIFQINCGMHMMDPGYVIVE